MVETLFVLYIQDTKYLVRCPFCVMQVLEREMNNIYIAIYPSAFLKPIMN